MLQFLLFGRLFISPHYAILSLQTIAPFKYASLTEPPSTLFGLHLAKLQSPLITAVRTSHFAEEQCIFAIIIIIITIISQSSSSALQSLVGFGILHNSPPACSVLCSSLQPLTPIITKFITTLSSHPVRGRPFLLQKTLPFSTLLGVHSSDTPHVLVILPLSFHERCNVTSCSLLS